MKIKVTTNIIKDLKPCQDRLDNWLSHYSKFNGDITKFLRLEAITHNDKIWVAVRLIPVEMRIVFALDSSFAAAAYAADAAAYAAAAADAAAYAAADAAAAYAAAAAADAAYAADAAAYAADAAAAYAAAAAADAAYAADAAARKTERERQIEVLIYLIKGE